MADRVGVAVLTALDLEFEAVRGYLTDLRTLAHRAGTLFETGILRGTPVRVALAVSGPGNQAAAVLTERLVSTFDPRAVFVVGIAGALRPDLALGDVVVATRVYGHHGGRDEASGLLARPRAWDAPHHLEAGEVVLGSRNAPLAGHIRRHYNDAVAVEMESAGAAQAAHLNGAVPMLTIRGVSDRADEDKSTTDMAGWPRLAAAHAAAFAAALIERVAATGDRQPRPAVADRRSSPAGRTGDTGGTITMTATASGTGNVYQAAGDQHIYGD